MKLLLWFLCFTYKHFVIFVSQEHLLCLALCVALWENCVNGALVGFYWSLEAERP